jgi:hypothetical protein
MISCGVYQPVSFAPWLPLSNRTYLPSRAANHARLTAKAKATQEVGYYTVVRNIRRRWCHNVSISYAKRHWC